jgi:hypothetical protein
MRHFFSDLSFHLPTAIYTVIALPFIAAMVLSIRRLSSALGKYLIDWLLFALSQLIFKHMAAVLTLRRYTRLALVKNGNTLYIPSLKDVTINIDKIFIPLSLERSMDATSYDHTNIFSLLVIVFE